MRSFFFGFCFLLFIPFFSISQNCCQLVAATTFLPEWKRLGKENIQWYWLSVPEDWAQPEGKKIRLAVAVLKAWQPGAGNSVVFIQGGPGGGAIGSLSTWLEHPLRKYSDIVLVDLRGTGYSQPALCPDLGKEFFHILAKDQNPEQDEDDKIKACIQCRQDLINRGINIQAYNSAAVSRDLDALRSGLRIAQWSVYGVSYGTFIAQYYSDRYPKDVKQMILDSSIPDISQYYNKNTSNYTGSLEHFFQLCRQDSVCNKEFPNLENVYFSVIDRLKTDPITVELDKKIVPSGKFTYNAEDFKIAVQRSLYSRRLIEILPSVIYQFHERNTAVLSTLVAAFSEAFSLDFGTYYCFTCKEAIPYNSIDSFNADAGRYARLSGGLDFYKSDFLVCEKWNKGVKTIADTALTEQNNIPVLIFTGEFDPITPASFAEATAKRYANHTLIRAGAFGHAPAFSDTGDSIVSEFINTGVGSDMDRPDFRNRKVNFANGIILNKGVANFGRSLGNFDLIFFFPLILAIGILAGHSSYLVYNKVRKNKQYGTFLSLLFIASSAFCISSLLFTVIAVNKTSEINYYILALGLPGKYGFVFYLYKLFLAFSLGPFLLSIVNIKKAMRTSYYMISLFSLIVANSYVCWWGFYS